MEHLKPFTVGLVSLIVYHTLKLTSPKRYYTSAEPIAYAHNIVIFFLTDGMCIISPSLSLRRVVVLHRQTLEEICCPIRLCGIGLV